MKKIISVLLTLVMVLALGSMTVFAATTPVSTAAELASAITAAAPNDTIKLAADITATATITIDRTITLDLNGFDLCVPGYGSKNIYVTGGSLTITGSGKIYEKEDNRWYGVVIIKEADAVTIGPDVILEGCGGVMLPGDATGDPIITIEGTINSLKDKGGDDGWGLYINGTVQNKTTYPTFYVKNTAVINSTGHGIYAAGYGQWNIEGGTITGVASAIGIKAGILNISGGTLRVTGPATVPTTGYSNGINASGCAIQIESNDGYAGDIKINITGGYISSLNGYAVYEYIAEGTVTTKVTSIYANAPAVLWGEAGTALVSNELFTLGVVAIHDEAIGTGDGANSEVTANADVTYTVIIPSSVDFGTIYKNTGTKTKNFPITVQDALLEAGKAITVTQTTAVLNMYAGTIPLAFTFTPASGGFVFTGNETKTGTVACDTTSLTAAGSYKGYMTFSVTYAG